MPTFAELKTRISGRLQDPNNTAVSAANVGTSINDAINYWKQRRFWFNEYSETVNTVANQAALPALSTTLLYLLPRYGMSLVDQQLVYNLSPVSPEIYNAMNITQTGRPSVYTWINGAYNLYFIPQQAYAITVSGVKDYAALVNDSDTNDFTTYADQLIMYDALSRVEGEYRMDAEMSNYYSDRARDESRNLMKRTNAMHTTGRLAVYDLVDNYTEH